MPYVELITDHPLNPALKAGTIIDQKEGMARALITDGLAKESTVAEYTTYQQDAKIGAMEERLANKLTELVRSIGRTPSASVPMSTQALASPAQPPGTGPGVVYGPDGVAFNGQIVGGEAPCERGVECFSDILRCIYYQQAKGTPDDLLDYAEKRLNKVYGFNRTSFEVDPKGRIFSVERDASGAVITRTGTESVTGGPSYGFLVKPEYYGNLHRIMIENSVLSDEAFMVPIGNTLELKWPALDQFGVPIAGQSSAYAGVVVTRAGEIQQRIYSDGKVREIDYKVTDLTGFTTLSRDLIADNYIAADALVQELFGMAFAWKFDWECLNGMGAGMPLGIFQSPATLIDGPTSNHRTAANHIYYEDIVWMQSRLHASLWKECFYLVHQTTLPELMALRAYNGGTTSIAPIYQPNAMLTQEMPPSIRDQMVKQGYKFKAGGTLNGIPVKYSEKVPVLGTTGDISLICPKAYGVAQRAGLEVGLSDQFLFDTDRIAYRSMGRRAA